MAEPEFGEFDLQDIVCLLGPQQVALRGPAEGEFISIEPTSDEGAGLSGAFGGGVLVKRRNGLYDITLTLLPTSSTIGVIGGFIATGAAFSFYFQHGQSKWAGRTILKNRGKLTGDTGAGPRTIALIGLRTAGVMAPVGNVLAL